MRHFTILFAVILVINHVAAKTCEFTINMDMQKKAPMFISPTSGKSILLPTKRNGEVELPKDDKVLLACPGTTNNVDGYSSKMVTATCSSGKLFSIDGSIQLHSISDIQCRQYPAPYTSVIGNCAGNQGQLIQVGFEFNAGNKPYMSICFNPQDRKTYWSKAVVTGLSQFICTVNNIAFKKEYFGTIDPDDRYKNQHQRLPSAYIIHNNGLERGHLVAKCDFVDAARKRMTYYYINTAPQWKSFNNGNWKNLEVNVRQEAADRNTLLHVYTGTHGILELSTRTITLDSSGKMPVPLYFWKVVIEKLSGEGVAFIGVNDPFNLHPMICPDICNNIIWLTMPVNKRTDMHSGIIYCCTIEELKKVPAIVLPNFQEYKGGLLD